MAICMAQLMMVAMMEAGVFVAALAPCSSSRPRAQSRCSTHLLTGMAPRPIQTAEIRRAGWRKALTATCMASPHRNLVVGTDGALYGVMNWGGAGSAPGIIYKI